MDWPSQVIFAVLLFVCVKGILPLPHVGHRKTHSHTDGASVRSLHSKHAAKHVKHHVTIGAPRQMVPSPVQDFVLLSGSPLFHERTRTSDSKENGKDQSGNQEFQGNGHGGGQVTVPVQGQGQGQGQLPSQTHGQGVGQTSVVQPGQHPAQGRFPGQTQGQNPPQGQPQGRIPGHQHPAQGQNQGQGQLQISGANGHDSVQQANESPNLGPGENKGSHATQPTEGFGNQTNINGSAAVGNLNNATLEGNHTTGVAPSKITTANVLLGVNNITVNGSGEGWVGQSVNQTNATTAADLKMGSQGQKQGAGHFPFNIPGLRHYGSEKNGNKGGEQPGLAKDHGKLGLDANLGPNCHWKTTKGKNGAVITSVACSGEFSKGEESKGGLDGENNKKPLVENAKQGAGDSTKEMQMTAGNVSKAGGVDVGKHVQNDIEFQEEAVATTNSFRKIHRALPMKLSTELCRQATEYAEKIASMGSLQHDYDAVRHLDEGENLAMGCKQYGVPLTAKEAITNWYNEVCAYDFDRGEFSMATGHFTQVVWSNSDEFGIGKAAGMQNGMPCTFVVGRFKPSGNYKSEYKTNVFKGTFDPSYCDKLRDKKLLT